MTLLERARKWGEERDQLWLEKGLQKGIEQERQASIQRERALVHRMTARRFGPDTAERLLPLLDQFTDPDDILAVADAVIESETAEDFLRQVEEA